ncbi:MAG TPA: hypothetical protein DHW61_09420 [Lachnoclostridium phytofermentans]|uniref:Uncharacterized protein n=1 Tax=Lachnoclostridium phytofermentans TaxID=66219 RepID=A0A3D2X8D6_9FIRM|nr:hypothetical protein [Lachnoclostridium phytofermentans]
MSQTQRLIASLNAMIDSFEAPCERGYYQGSEGYEHWITGLCEDNLWNDSSLENEVERRGQVNDALLLNLGDARRCAGVYLNECVSLLHQEEARMLNDIAHSYTKISERVLEFREKLNKRNGKILCYNGSIQMKLNMNLRNEQILLLKDIKVKEQQLVEEANYLLDCMAENQR